jgi:hypothetical protein
MTWRAIPTRPYEKALNQARRELMAEEVGPAKQFKMPLNLFANPLFLSCVPYALAASSALARPLVPLPAQL